MNITQAQDLLQKCNEDFDRFLELLETTEWTDEREQSYTALIERVDTLESENKELESRLEERRTLQKTILNMEKGIEELELKYKIKIDLLKRNIKKKKKLKESL